MLRNILSILMVVFSTILLLSKTTRAQTLLYASQRGDSESVKIIKLKNGETEIKGCLTDPAKKDTIPLDIICLYQFKKQVAKTTTDEKGKFKIITDKLQTDIDFELGFYVPDYGNYYIHYTKGTNGKYKVKMRSEPFDGPPVAVYHGSPNIQAKVDFAPMDASVDTVTMTKGKVYTFVQQMPEFAGGQSALMQYLSTNIHYPAKAVENQVEGTVMLQFIVKDDGSISDVKVLRDVSYGCTEEALRVVKAMPKWKPGRDNGNNVNVKFNLPITFKLTDDDEPKKSK